MRTARLQSVLLEADGPLVIVLRDVLEGAWLGTVIDRVEGGDAFLCIPVSASRLAAFRHGTIDLRAVFTMPEVDTPARVVVPGNALSDTELPLIDVAEIAADWLPDEGFYLTTFLEPVASEYEAMASLATAENRPILRVNLNPIEARAAHVIDIDHLGTALVLFQNGVKQAHNLVTRSLSYAARRVLSSPENYTFEALAFSGNSFEVHMRAKAVGTLFGDTPHIAALEKLDEIASVVDDTEAAVAVARENRGHFVGAVTALMQFIASKDVPISYAWTAPGSERMHPVTIRPESALALYEALAVRQELTRQDVALIGVFDKIHRRRGRWEIETMEGEIFRGSTKAGADINLTGIVIGSAVYSIQCVELLMEGTGSGRQSTKLEMVSQPRELPAAP